MNPEMQKMQEQLDKLSTDIQSVLEWKAAREQTQIKEPLDDASKTAIGAIFDAGGAIITPTQNVNVAAVPTTISIGKIPTAFRAITIGGAQFYIATYTP